MVNARKITKQEAEARIAATPAGACTMCDLASGAAPIATNDEAVAVLAPYATRPGHVLVVLRRHALSIAQLERQEWLALNDLSWRIARAMERAFAPARTYVAALGSVSALPMSFPHVHQHVVPLFDGGEADRPAEVFTWRNGVYVYDDAQVAETLRSAVESQE